MLEMVTDITLPNSQYIPPLRNKLLRMKLVPLLVCSNLFDPEYGIRLGGTCMLATVVTVPETASRPISPPGKMIGLIT